MTPQEFEQRVTDDYKRARAELIKANGWMAANGGALIWGIAGVIVGFVLGRL